MAPRGRHFATDDELEHFLDGLPVRLAGTYGGHTSCVEIETGGPEYVLCDLGSGVRPFGQAAMAQRTARTPQTFHIFMSHLHWDHIMGLPFFMPAFIPGTGSSSTAATAARGGAAPPAGAAVVPGRTSRSSAPQVEFVHLEPGRRHEVAGMSVTPLLQRHTGDSYGYRFSAAAARWSTRPIPSTS